MHNVGAIFRSADGAGFDEVILSGYTGGPPDQRIAKVALGAEEFLPHRRAANIDELLELLDGVFVVVMEQDRRALPPHDVKLPQSQMSVALIACGEIFGAPEPLLERADAILELPMRGRKESLNVSVAFGIAAYALADQRFKSNEYLCSRRPDSDRRERPEGLDPRTVP
jgi:tRNA G18 (ribose-2'-O)-methylase SpoU